MENNQKSPSVKVNDTLKITVFTCFNDEECKQSQVAIGIDKKREDKRWAREYIYVTPQQAKELSALLSEVAEEAYTQKIDEN